MNRRLGKALENPAKSKLSLENDGKGYLLWALRSRSRERKDFAGFSYQFPALRDTALPAVLGTLRDVSVNGAFAQT